MTPKAAPAKKPTPAKNKPEPKQAPTVVEVKTDNFAEALNAVQMQIAQLTQTVAAQGQQLAKMAKQQDALMKAIAEQKPVVNLPPRPKAFTVAIEGSDGETRTMTVAADMPQSH